MDEKSQSGTLDKPRFRVFSQSFIKRAWGEMGLDYHYDNSPREVQKEVFAKQLQLAVSVKKPIVVHTREAEEDTLALMKQHLPVDWPIHVHCFTSSVDLATQLLAHFKNLYIGPCALLSMEGRADWFDRIHWSDHIQNS